MKKFLVVLIGLLIGAVASANAIPRGVFDPRMFGAKGIGSAHDDGPAFQAAFDAAKDFTQGNPVTAQRSGLVVTTPAQRGGYYYIATAVSESLTASSTSSGSNYLAWESTGMDAPIVCNVGTSTDCFSFTYQAEYEGMRVEHIAFMGHDLVSNTRDARSLLVITGAGAAPSLQSINIVNDIYFGGAAAYANLMNLTGGSFSVHNIQMHGAVSFGADYTDGIKITNFGNASVQDVFEEYEFNWGGTYTANGTHGGIVGLYPSTDSSNPSIATIRNVRGDARAQYVTYASNSSFATNNRGSVVVEGCSKDTGAAFVSAIGLSSLIVKNDIQTGGATKFLDLYSIGSVKIEDSISNARNVTVDSSLFGAAYTPVVEIKNTTIAAANLTIGGLLTGATFAHDTESGVESEFGTASSAVSKGQLVKGDSSNDYKLVALATSDDAVFAVGAATEAVSSGIFRYQMRKGQHVTLLSDGTAITRWQLLYASGVTGGDVSNVAIGSPVGVAMKTVSSGAATAFDAVMR